MANEVFANGRELCCKKGDGKSIAAFPDVCFTPPLTPATPPGVPIPYPNTAMATDTTDGTKAVKITGQEVMLKDKSNLKKAAGNEAGCAPKKGVVTSTQHPAGSPTQSKAYFNAWSMDVKFEGENVVRHLDLTTHNHASNKPGQTPPWPFMDSMARGGADKCQKDRDKEADACSGLATKEAQCENEKCQNARKCLLSAYKPDRCCKSPPPGQTGHHLIEVHGMCKPGKPRGIPVPPFDGSNGKERYDQNAAPVVCASCPKGSRYYMEHGDLHAVQGIKENAAIATAKQAGRDPKKAWNYGEARQAGVDAHAATFKDSGCDDACIAAQLDAYHKDKVGISDDELLRTEKVKFKKDPDQRKRGEDLIQELTNRRGAAVSGGR